MRAPSVSPTFPSAMRSPAPGRLAILRKEIPAHLSATEQAYCLLEKQKALGEYLISAQGERYLDLTHTRLSGLNLENLSLSFVNFYAAELNDTRLTGANLYYANFRCASLQRADLQNTNMAHTILISTNLYHANLSNTNMQCANFSQASLLGAITEGTDFAGSNIEQVLLMPY